jgi:hypothetical protein
MFNVKFPQYIGKKRLLRFDVVDFERWLRLIPAGKPPNDYNAKVLAQLLKGGLGRIHSFHPRIRPRCGVLSGKSGAALCIAVNAVADAQF